MEEGTKLEVTVTATGEVRIVADPVTACRLTGRSIYGKVPEAQSALEEAIAVAWYLADCPRYLPAIAS